MVLRFQFMSTDGIEILGIFLTNKVGVDVSAFAKANYTSYKLL
jgi:hypothetical protein